MKVRSQTRLAKRGPVYYFRARIPEDFTSEQRQQLLAEWHQRPARVRFARGKVVVASEIMQSLQTKDKKAAESSVRIKSVELDSLIEKVRQSASAAPPQTTISDAEILRIVAKATASRMGADEATRTLGLSEVDFARHLKWLESLETTTTMAIARGNFEALQELADDWLDGHGYLLPKDSEDYRRFCYEFAKAQARVNQQLRARDRGEAVDTPAAPLELPAHEQPGGNLTALCEYWQQQKKPRPKTIIEAESILRRFREVCGDLAPAKVTRRHVLAFRDALVDQGKAPGTVKKLLGLFGSMLQVALAACRT